MFLRFIKNEYGKDIGEFKCEFCLEIFTVSVSMPGDETGEWVKNIKGCQSRECDSYDPAHDIDMLLEEGAIELYSEPKQTMTKH